MALPSNAAPITELLNLACGGGEKAFAQLIEAVYADLRAISANKMQHQFNRRLLGGLTIQPTEIVQEAVIKLMKQHAEFNNRGHFFAVAAAMIRSIIIDYQRRRMSLKHNEGNRGGHLPQQDPIGHNEMGIVEFDDLLQALENESPEAAEIVCLRFVCNHSNEEIAKLLGVSISTIRREWIFASAFLKVRYKGK